MTDGAAVPVVDSVRPRHRRSLALHASELGFFLVVGDLCAAAVAAYGTPVLWAVVDREFAPTAGLPLGQLIFPVAWTLWLRLFGGGDIVTPRFARRSIAAVAQTYVAATALVLGTFFFMPFFIPRASSLATTAVAAVVTLMLRYLFLGVHARRKQRLSFVRRLAIAGLRCPPELHL